MKAYAVFNPKKDTYLPGATAISQADTDRKEKELKLINEAIDFMKNKDRFDYGDRLDLISNEIHHLNSRMLSNALSQMEKMNEIISHLNRPNVFKRMFLKIKNIFKRLS